MMHPINVAEKSDVGFARIPEGETDVRPGFVGFTTRGFLAAVICVATLAAASAQTPPAPIVVDGPAHQAPWVRYRDWSQTTWPTYNTLSERTRTPVATGKPIDIVGEIAGDPKKGQDLAFARSRGGGCLACHVMGPASQETPGNAGPDLSEIGSAGRPDSYLYNYIHDPRHLNAASSMPPWGAHGFYNDEEIRHMVAFLKTLKTPARFRSALDDPEKRPKPVEDRDALDPFVNPAVDRIDAGRALFAKAGPGGKSCVSCHADEKKFAGWAVTMPRWEPRMKKMLGVEEFIFRHASATTGEDYRMQSTGNTDLSVFLHSLSNGLPINVDISSADAKPVYDLGKTLFETKIGQFNFSCGDCHDPNRGGNKWLRGQFVGESKGQLDHFPLWRTSRGAGQVWDVRKRLQWCNVQVRADVLPPDVPEYDALELYLKAQSQGYKLTAPNIRH